MGDPELGQRIREARLAMGMTQQDFAALVGWKDSQSVSNAERGITGVPADRLRAISVATGRPLSYFMDGPAEGDSPRTLLLGEVGASVATIAESSAEMLRVLRSIDTRLARLEALVGPDAAGLRAPRRAPSA